MIREPFARRLLELEWGRPRRASLCADPLSDLEQRIRETQAWCALRPVSGANTLRPSSIAPSTMAMDRWQLVDEVLKRRRRDLSTTELPVAGNAGRLLLYFPDVDLGTGMANAQCDFFDLHSAPPWGTWVGYFEERSNPNDHAKYLLAWVPTQLEAHANLAMLATPDGCIRWVTDTNVELREVLTALEPNGVGQ